MDINIVNILISSTVGTTGQIIDRVISQVIVTKTIFVRIKFKFTSISKSIDFPGTDQTGENTNFGKFHNFLKINHGVTKRVEFPII